jgi:acyl carrier protein
MTQETYETTIITFLENNILAEGVKINPQTVLHDMGIDSYSIVEIILFIERQYNYVMPDHLLKSENFETIEKIAEILKREIK